MRHKAMPKPALGMAYERDYLVPVLMSSKRVKFAIDIFGAVLSTYNPRYVRYWLQVWPFIGADGEHGFDDISAFTWQLSA
jgi:hypothetical protein